MQFRENCNLAPIGGFSNTFKNFDKHVRFCCSHENVSMKYLPRKKYQNQKKVSISKCKSNVLESGHLRRLRKLELRSELND